MVTSKLTALQVDFSRAFFVQEDRFFLTGGAALAGFHLGHREIHDLDLFTLTDVMEAGFTAVLTTTRQLGASLEALQTSPDFQGRRSDASATELGAQPDRSGR